MNVLAVDLMILHFMTIPYLNMLTTLSINVSYVLHVGMKVARTTEKYLAHVRLNKGIMPIIKRFNCVVIIPLRNEEAIILRTTFSIKLQRTSR